MRRTLRLLPLVIGLLICFSLIAQANDKPSFEIKPYGYFKLDGSYDQNLTSHGNFVMWVAQPDPAREGDDEQFNMTANETRLGLWLNSENYNPAQIGARVEFDLYGGFENTTVADNQAVLMLRHAYFTVESGQWKLLAGQSWDLISPLNAPTLNYSALWGCGNIGYLRPQVSLWYNPVQNDETRMTMAGGFFRNFGPDLTPSFTLALGEDADGYDDGIDAGIPSFQGLLDFNHTWYSGTSLRIGVSGLWGQLKAETNVGNYENYESWGVIGHLAFNFGESFGILGEGYTGLNLGSYFGGILQNSTIEGVNSFGGWGSLWFKATPKFKFTAGYGYDDPKDEDIYSGRSWNNCIFGNIQYNLVGNVNWGIEVSRWETEYKDPGGTYEKYDNLRVQSSFVFNY
jgi:hypothetical protein